MIIFNSFKIETYCPTSAKKYLVILGFATIVALSLLGITASTAATAVAQKEIKGTFRHVHTDDFKNDKSSDRYYIKDEGTNKHYQVYFNNKEVNAKSGDTVKLKGVESNNGITANTDELEVVSSTAATTTNSRKVAVIMFNWQNDQRTTFTEETARAAYFTGSNSTNAYLKENSFGQTELTGHVSADGDIFGWYTIPYNNTGCSVADHLWADAADAQAEAAGVNLYDYEHISYVFPAVPDCGYSGAAELWGDPARSWINGTDQGTITHEIGHNLGSHHASSLSCVNSSGVRVAISTSCTLSEYGDPFSVMGQSNGYKHFNNFEKGHTGGSINWLAPNNTVNVDRYYTPDSTHTIAPLEQVSTGVQTLRIPLYNSTTPTAGQFYYLEFRQPFGFDNFTASSPVVNGVSIRLASDYLSSSQSQLIDATPSTSSYLDSALGVGKTFVDPDRGINITVLSVGPSGAQVRVWFNNTTACTRANPTLTVTPISTSILPGQQKSFSYTIKNNDSRRCPTSRYSLTPNLPAGFTFQYPEGIYHDLAAGASASGSFSIASSSSIPLGNYAIPETAQNVIIGALKSTVSLNITVQSNQDTTAPDITISSPTNGAKITKTLKITAGAADSQSGVAEIRLLVDGVLVKSCAAVTTCSHSVAGSSLSSGSHTVTVEARDNIGNQSTKSVSVTK